MSSEEMVLLVKSRFPDPGTCCFAAGEGVIPSTAGVLPAVRLDSGPLSVTKAPGVLAVGANPEILCAPVVGAESVFAGSGRGGKDGTLFPIFAVTGVVPAVRVRSPNPLIMEGDPCAGENGCDLGCCVTVGLGGGGVGVVLVVATGAGRVGAGGVLGCTTVGLGGGGDGVVLVVATGAGRAGAGGVLVCTTVGLGGGGVGVVLVVATGAGRVGAGGVLGCTTVGLGGGGDGVVLVVATGAWRAVAGGVLGCVSTGVEVRGVGVGWALLCSSCCLL